MIFQKWYYGQIAIRNRVSAGELRAGGVQNTTIQQFGNIIVSGDRLYAPFIIANGIFIDLVAYFTFVDANPNGARDLQVPGNNIFGFEDLPSHLDGLTPDNDFNRAVLQFNFAI